MDWNQLLSTKRLGMESWKSSGGQEDRTQFQRDYDRIVFSSPFRRMQNKTQVFPLPEHIFVHNRLTHSLEVASVGRSLGNRLAERILPVLKDNALVHEIGTIVSTACLAHDLGNPPFGHSGESAISNFFLSGAGKEFQEKLAPSEWSDFTMFDGNANAFRILTHQFRGKRPGGFALTYPTLASIVKYPFESSLATKQKFGFFQSEMGNFRKLLQEFDLPLMPGERLASQRYPLVYLVEAADDICYQIMDLEDSCRLGILSYDRVKELYMNFYDRHTDGKDLLRIEDTLKKVSDKNEQISYLRAGVIGLLIHESMRIFENNQQKILSGNFKSSLIGSMEGVKAKAMNQVRELSFNEIYAHRTVVEIEIAGFKIIGTLLEEFIGAVVHPLDHYSKKLLSLMPEQFRTDSEDLYLQIQSAVDFISGMTDVFALDLYRKIKGIDLPGVA